MGYRSDVGLCLTGAGKKVLDAKLAKLEPGTEMYRDLHGLMNFPDDKREDQKTGAIAWLWKRLKWYPDYEDVAFIEKMLRNLSEEEYLFIRVGEHLYDAEERGDFWDNPFGMYLVRSVAFE